MYRLVESTVEVMVEENVAFTEIEAYIDEQHNLTREEKAVLWLLAWSDLERDERKAIIAV